MKCAAVSWLRANRLRSFGSSTYQAPPTPVYSKTRVGAAVTVAWVAADSGLVCDHAAGEQPSHRVALHGLADAVSHEP